MSRHYSVVIVGGGQAGLSASYLLKERKIDHLILERKQVAHAWRNQRWNSFCLVTPNWQCRLPGFHYAGKDPQGFMIKDQIVQYIEEYVRSFAPPIIENAPVTSLRRDSSSGRFEIESTAGHFTADNVIVAVGGYHTPNIPRMAERLPADILQIHSAQYKDSSQMPEGDVMVVGSGQSGCQIAEDLHLAGRRAHLAVGGAPRVARRYRGKDVVEWLDHMRYYDLSVYEHPLKEGVRGRTNHYVTGRDGGRDIDLRKLALEGMTLHGRLLDIDGGTMSFADDLKQNLDKADEVSQSIKNSIDKYIEKHKLEAPTEAPYVPVWEPRKHNSHVDLRQAGIRAIIWSIGYRSDFRWIDVPIFDGRGYPGHLRGVTSVAGLFFLGLPWLWTWGSGRFSGIARDARYLVDRIEARSGGGSPDQPAAAVEEVAIGS